MAQPPRVFSRGPGPDRNLSRTPRPCAQLDTAVSSPGAEGAPGGPPDRGGAGIPMNSADALHQPAKGLSVGRPPDRPMPTADVLSPPGRPPGDTDSVPSSSRGPVHDRNRSRTPRPSTALAIVGVPGRPPDAASTAPAASDSAVRLRVNGAALHTSHSFGFYRGMYWCWRCQGVASSKPRTLAKPCTSTHRPDKLRPAVSQLRNRVLPSNIQQYGWPLPEGSIPILAC